MKIAPAFLLAGISCLVLGVISCEESHRASPSQPAVADSLGGDSGQSTEELARLRAAQTEAAEIAPGVFQVLGTGNTHVVLTAEGHVVLDTGLPNDAAVARDLLEGIADGPASHIVVTHAHADHYGGADAWMGDETELIAHEEFVGSQEYLTLLAPYMMRRNKIFFPEDVPDLPDAVTSMAMKLFYPNIEPTVLFRDEYEFEVGGRKFVAIHTPGAEGSDSVSIWMPVEKILFTGDLFGPLFPMWPNLVTLRGEKVRQALPYIRSLDTVLALEPEILVPSHFPPVRGKEKIREAVQRMRDAVQFVHDETIEGMNSGKDVYQLMNEIRLPEHLDLSEGHGKVDWGVRSIWEGYTGWFGFESTTELYPVPRATVYPELARLAGGAGVLAESAQAELDGGRPVEALHLLDVALAAEPGNREALEVRLAALEELLRRSGGENHFEVYWLRHRIAATRDSLS